MGLGCCHRNYNVLLTIIVSNLGKFPFGVQEEKGVRVSISLTFIKGRQPTSQNFTELCI